VDTFVTLAGSHAVRDWADGEDILVDGFASRGYSNLGTGTWFARFVGVGTTYVDTGVAMATDATATAAETFYQTYMRDDVFEYTA
jgi:hypothetical protein